MVRASVPQDDEVAWGCGEMRDLLNVLFVAALIFATSIIVSISVVAIGIAYQARQATTVPASQGEPRWVVPQGEGFTIVCWNGTIRRAEFDGSGAQITGEGK